jgi:hypothetical protein
MDVKTFRGRVLTKDVGQLFKEASEYLENLKDEHGFYPRVLDTSLHETEQGVELRLYIPNE